MATFHPDYEHLIAGLPPSQLAECVKRLTTGRQAIPAEAVAELGERQEAVLTAISAAYARKKDRSRAASQRRRDAPLSVRSDDNTSAAELPPIELTSLDDVASAPEASDAAPEAPVAPRPRPPHPKLPLPLPHRKLPRPRPKKWGRRPPRQLAAGEESSSRVSTGDIFCR